MPTPVGPAPRDPNDPDLWEEWGLDDDDDMAPPGFGWPIRLVALVVILAFVLLLVV